MTPTEHAEQVTFVTWFRETFPNVLIFAIPNGEFRHESVAKRLKDEGVTKGVPDLCVPEWKLFIEMKRAKGGRLSPEQREIIDYLISVGYDVIIAKGAQEAREKINDRTQQNL